MPRTVHAADVTGHVLLQLLYEQLLARGIHVYEEYFAWRLVIGAAGCEGVLTWDLARGGVKALAAKAVILATGGSGRVYHGSTNAHACTADGMAMALRAGLPLEDLEFVQFHPTTLFPSGLLVTEAVRGEGGYLLNSSGARFMRHYAPEAMELASRDVVSRGEQTEIDEGRSVEGSLLLDMRHFGREKMLERFHGTRDLALTYAGLDPLERPLPVRPGAHYHMGGVASDVDGLTELENVFAAGEVACVSLHGANRLGGNSLRVAAQPVGAVQRDAGHLARREDVLELREPVDVAGHAAHVVVGARAHRKRPLERIETGVGESQVARAVEALEHLLAPEVA